MRLLLTLALLASACTSAAGVDAGAPMVVDAGPLIVDAGATRFALGVGGPDDSHIWPTVAKTLAIDAAELTRCDVDADCTTIAHFTRCCSQLPIAKAFVKRVMQRRQDYGFVQTPSEKTLCEIGDCAGGPYPAACVAGRCEHASR